MRVGDILEGRFELEQRIGSGGMGEVFRARDHSSNETVAVKILLEEHGPLVARFEREAALLASLSHPAIVRYVAHGLARGGELYLVMEWLEGEDLRSRLNRKALTISEAVMLGARVGNALGVAHARGVVHRDLKPSNLVLHQGAVEQVKVVDFGVARSGGAHLTQTGVLIGTPGYMAPEQARSSPTIDARVDVFALGCVLFLCLTGRPAFPGDHIMAVLGKIVHQEAPRVSDFHPEIPPTLDALIARMLEKDPDHRPSDGAAVAAELEALEAASWSSLAQCERPPASWALTGLERRMLSVVLMADGDRRDKNDAPTFVGGAITNDEAIGQTMRQHGGRLDRLADGSTLVTIADKALGATDQVAQAARCALALRVLCPDRPIALATGRADIIGTMPAGDVLDQAADLLVQISRGPLRPSPAPIAIDEVTAGLLDARFEVADGDAGLLLRSQHEIGLGARPLLGKPTSCVGRETELATLEALLEGCVDQAAAQAVMVTAPAGVGKSRLVAELINRIGRRGERVAIWSGRGDALRTGSPLGIIGQTLRHAIGIQESEPLEERRARLHTRVAERRLDGQKQGITEFLGELCGAPFFEDVSAPLQAARQDAQLMSEQMRRAWLSFLRAETAVSPVLLVLEDLHWCDPPSVWFIDVALRELAEAPWMVLALSRPDVHTLFPKLWAERRVQEIRLTKLPRRASERLVRQVLGDGVGAETVERLVKQAEGHAFYLEELIRAVASGKGETLPETVLAMVEARLSELEGEARRVLRAASVFGEVFWEGGVSSLLGGVMRSTLTGEWLTHLVEREVLGQRPDTRFPGERELVFRHALLREGAYAMLTEDDKKLGHRLAAEWLERAGETDPILLATHFERGEDSARAGTFYLRAAEQALRASDADTAAAHAERGLACAVPDDVRASLLAILCDVHAWKSDVEKAAAYADETLRLAAPGSVPWATATWAKLHHHMHHQQIDEITETMRFVRQLEPAPHEVGTVAWMLGTGEFMLHLIGLSDAPGESFAWIRAHLDPVAATSPLARGLLLLCGGFREPLVNEDPWAGLLAFEAARASYEEANYRRLVSLTQVFAGMSCSVLGALERAEKELSGTLGEDLGLSTALRDFFLTHVLADRGALDEASASATRMIESGRAAPTPFEGRVLEGRGRWALADILLCRGHLDAALFEALAASELLGLLPVERAGVLATRAAVWLAQGRVEDALSSAREAADRYRGEMSFVSFVRAPFVRRVLAEALLAAGDRSAACVTIAEARDHLRAVAGRILDPGYKRSFLENVPENVRTLSLARTLLGDPPEGP
jgi:tetratricopeptide (TPR) repeat protein